MATRTTRHPTLDRPRSPALRRAALAGCAAAALGALPALPGAQAVPGLGAAAAQAAVPGRTVATAASAYDSSAVKQLSVTCPAGTKVIGVGASHTGPAGRVVLDEVKPTPSLQMAGVVAAEVGPGTGAAWNVYLTAQCAAPLPGQVLVVRESTLTSAATRSVTASCPSGTKLVGGGGQVNGTAGVAGLDEVTPLPQLAGVVAVAAEPPTGSAESWYAGAYAICAAPLPGQALVTSSSPVSSSTSKERTATCPAGTVVLSASAQVDGPAGEVVLAGFRPLSSGTKARGWAAETWAGTPDGWSLTTRAVCAAP
ncbi:hypothetical protein [Vallicoccus soli]|uniref:Uncharacterized protein n=1 Tax=Vallicoccus soli TaxID=2339232 RepID=A0A3A3Z169_9ACTN|nr:hypothetical protein [Vallicoccus soli]RJK96923.1 hypothetical protein D5H78_06665 [Vallicoccus soli]